jgi:hypothetical protein
MLARYEWPEPADGASLTGERRRIASRHRSPSHRRRELAHVLERVRREQGVEPRVLWKVTVPAGDPLACRGTPEEEHVDLSDHAVVVAYRNSKRDLWRLTAFTVAAGKRLWDIAMGDDGPDAVVVTLTHAVVSLDDALLTFDIKTGEPALELRWPDIPRP